MNKESETITMSQKELSRIAVLQQLCDRQLSQKQAAKQLKLSARQIRRLQKSYQHHGAKSLASKKRNRPSNNRLSMKIKNTALELIRSSYQGFGPTLAHEKLTEKHGLNLSVESVRKLMIEQALWKKKSRKNSAHHQMRARRSCFGELVQIDGSPHDWFEGRAEKCCLLVFVDDATSKLLKLSFVAEESTQGYFNATQSYIKQYGRPLAFYSDRHSIFRINAKEAEKSGGETQFGRVLRELDIELICANSPQAKGRVERANKTLQDRLVKELRLRQIDTIEAANAYLPEFINGYNEKFGVEPAGVTDMHRKSLPSDEILNLIFSFQSERTLSKNLEASYNNVIYQVQTQSKSYAMRKAKITVYERDNAVILMYKGKKLNYKIFDKQNRPAPVLDSKQINKKLNFKLINKPKADHPWRKYPSSQPVQITV